MKKSLSYGALLAGTALTLFSCQKVNSIQEDKEDNKKNNLCLISSFSYSNSSVPSETIFTNHYDISGRSLEVEAGIFSGGAIFTHLTFSVRWTSDRIIFLDAGAVQDTILYATFDRKGRVEGIFPGNKPNDNFLPTTFEYNNNRVRAMNITLAGNIETSYFDYDQRGNLVSISDVPTTSVPIPGKVEHQYSSSEKAVDQFYFDEPRKFSWNSFTVLQYIGLFPELQPANFRTSTKVTWGNNYQAYHMEIKNHQVDGNGKLVSYDIVSPGSTTTISHYNINWSCNFSDLVQKQANN